MAILSNKRTCTRAHHRGEFARWPFVAVEGYRVEDRRKPDPRTAIEIAAAMKLPSGEVALVGDSDTDMRTAITRGGARGATWGYRSREVIQAAGARYLVDAPREVLELLDAPSRPEGS